MTAPAEYMREYNRRPEVMARDRLYRKRPDVAEQRRQSQAAYRKGPIGLAVKAASNARAKAKKAGCEGDVTPAVFLDLMARPCSYCGQEPAGGVDHVQPLSLGGRNDAANLTPCCLDCNRHKWKRSVISLIRDLCPRGHEYARHGRVYVYHSGPQVGHLLKVCRTCKNDARRVRRTA